MASKFDYSSNRSVMLWSTLLYKGMLAFDSRDYLRTMEYFESMQDKPLIIRFMLTTCYHHFSGEAWQRGEDETALDYTRKSLVQVPGDPYALFNLGVIIRQQELDGKIIEKPLEWRPHFEEFLRVAPDDQDFQAYRTVAKDILAGKYLSRPGLLLPPSAI